MNGDDFVEDELIEKWMEQERMIRYLLGFVDFLTSLKSLKILFNSCSILILVKYIAFVFVGSFCYFFLIIIAINTSTSIIITNIPINITSSPFTSSFTITS